MNEIDALLHENRKFPPPQSFTRNAHVSDTSIYERATADPEGFWEEQAKTLEWFKPWDKVLDWTPPHAKWFVGGELNVSVNCVDRHIKTARRNKAALIWEGEPGDRRTLTYWDLHVEVQKFANVLKKLGVGRGDRVAIYMPLIPEVVIAMLACTRIGAAHSVVFGGFSPDSLSDRINDAKCKCSSPDRLSPRGHRSAQAKRRQGDRRVSVDRTRRGRAASVCRRDEAFADMKKAATTGGTSHARRVARVRTREDGCRGRALHPLHVGHDRKAEGHRPHNRRLLPRSRRP
jgi:hypothetical protein